MAVAPLDSRQLCLSGSNGALVVLQLTDPARDKVQLQQYRVNVQGECMGSPEGHTQVRMSYIMHVVQHST